MRWHMKILLCTTSLGYGGAETHLITLAEKLTDLGHTVTVASSGGKLVSDLTVRAEHIKLPVFSRRLYRMICSSIALNRLIRKGDFDIVHTHARIPSLLCRRSSKKYGAAHIVTAHAHFKMTPTLRRLSVWGDRTIAVSEDIKELIAGSCDILPDRITVISNGIDTDRFSPSSRPRDRVKNIIFVSRMDSDCSLVARLLCRIAGRLREEFPDITITIVGGGNDLDAISALADGMNTALGDKVIKILGNRQDVNDLMGKADIFVGVSRAALEAAACGLPIILAGNEGYGGILSVENNENSNKKLAEMTNFCARGLPLPTADHLLNDIKKLINMPSRMRLELGLAARRYVLANNSLNSTVKETVSVYEKALDIVKKSKKKPRRRCSVTLCGYYGFQNSGDDAILDSLISTLRRKFSPNEIKVLTARPRLCRRRFEVKCINRTNLFSITRALMASSHLILGGGTLLQNSTSPRSLSYYLWVARLARLCRCKIMLVSSGIGPLIGRRAKKKTARLLSHAEFIGLREESALDSLKSLGLNPRFATVFADSALKIKNSTHSRVDFLLSKYIENSSDSSRHSKNESFGKVNKYIAISVRELRGESRRSSFLREIRSDFISRFASVVDDVANISGAHPIFLILSPEDGQISRSIVQKMSVQASVIPNLTPSEILGILSRCSLTVGMRLHLLIYALSVGTPAIGLDRDPKIAAHLAYSRMPPPFPCSLPDPDALVSRAISMIDSSDTIRQTLLARAAELRSLAEAEAEEILRVLGRVE